MKYIITASRINLGFPEEHNSDSTEGGKNPTQISYWPPHGCSSMLHPDRHWHHSQAEWVPHPPQSLLTPGPARIHSSLPWSTPAAEQLAKPPPLRSPIPTLPKQVCWLKLCHSPLWRRAKRLLPPVRVGCTPTFTAE